MSLILQASDSRIRPITLRRNEERENVLKTSIVYQINKGRLKAVGRILVSDICRRPENLVLRTSVGFENPSYALRRNEAWETLKKIVVCQINKGRLKLFRRPLLIYAQYVYA